MSAWLSVLLLVAGAMGAAPKKAPGEPSPQALQGTSAPSPRGILALWDFEDGAQGWTATDVNGDGYTWTVGTTDNFGPFQPPNFGTQYAYYSDDDAGSSVNEEIWTSPPTSVPITAVSLGLEFSWGYATYEYTDTLVAQVRTYRLSGWGNWETVWMMTPDQATYVSWWEGASGIATLNLTGYLPAQQVQVRFLYWDRVYPGWNWAVGVDNVTLRETLSMVYDEQIVATSHSQTMTAGISWSDTVVLRNWGNQMNTFTLTYQVIDTTGTVQFTRTQNVTHYLNILDRDTAIVFSGLPALSQGLYRVRIFHNLSGDVTPDNDSVSDYVLFLANHGYNNMRQVLVYDLDPALDHPSSTGGGYAGQSGVHLALALDNAGYIVDWVWGLKRMSFRPYELVMVTHGVYGDILENMPTWLIDTMRAYLYSTGGSAYCEGGDIWQYSYVWRDTTLGQMQWDTLFGVYPDTSGWSDGENDLDSLWGLPSTLIPYVDGKIWENGGENNWMDRLGLIDPEGEEDTIEAFLQTHTLSGGGEDTTYICGIVRHNGIRGYRTVAVNFELAFAQRLVRGDDSLLLHIVQQGLAVPPTLVAEALPGQGEPLRILAPGVVRGVLPVAFHLNRAGPVTLALYTVEGRRVRVLPQGNLEAGLHQVQMPMKGLASGVYLVVLENGEHRWSRRVVLLR